MSILWKIDYYISPSGKSPIQKFIDKLPLKTKRKVFRYLLHIEEYGINFSSTAIKKLIGYPLWEVRIVGKNSVRIFFIMKKRKQIVLIHAFIKKTNKTPKKEILIALKRSEEV